MKRILFLLIISCVTLYAQKRVDYIQGTGVPSRIGGGRGGIDTKTITVVPNVDQLTFSPDSITGLQFWFKGETITGVAEGGSVSNWPNSATQSTWYLTNTTAAQWPYLTNNFNGTGQKAVVYDGVDDRLQINAALALNVLRNTNDCAAIAVVRVNDTANQKIVLNISTGISPSNPRLCLYAGSGENLAQFVHSLDGDAGGGQFDPTVTPNGQVRCMYGEYTYTNKLAVSGSLCTLFTNGVQAVSGAGAVPTNTENTASQTIFVGFSGASSDTYQGEIAEVLFYVPMPSPSDRINIYNYLRTKYALP